MSSSITQSLTGIITPEVDPFNPAAWKVLMDRVKVQNDFLSFKSLEVIHQGLVALQQSFQQTESLGQVPPTPSNLARSAFVKLSRSYNSPILLKEIATFYLRDFQLPHIAKIHFERALQVGGKETELKPLIQAASVAAENLAASKEQRPAHHSGVTLPSARRPELGDGIRMTGKLTKAPPLPQLNPPRESILPSLRDSAPLPERTEDCLERARQEISAGRLSKAKTLLEKANLNPAESTLMWEVWTSLGEAFYADEQFEDATIAYGHASEYQPDLMTCHFNLGLALHLSGKFSEALIAYHRADRLVPNNPKVWCNLGALYFQMNDFHRSEMALRKAVQVQPDYARAWDNLAAAYGALGKSNEAYEACQKALSFKPHATESHYKMGAIHFSRSDWKNAIESFSIASQNPAFNAPANAYLAMTYCIQGDLRLAENCIRIAVAADPKCDFIWMAWNSLGVELNKLGYPDRALVAYSSAQVLKPDEPELWFNMGVAYQQLENFEHALDCYVHSVEYLPGHVSSWHNMGLIHVRMGKHDKAVDCFKKIVEVAPDNIQAWHDLAISLTATGHYDEAKAAFTRASQMAEQIAHAA